jgi:hypothetical protein
MTSSEAAKILKSLLDARSAHCWNTNDDRNVSVTITAAPIVFEAIQLAVDILEKHPDEKPCRYWSN